MPSGEPVVWVISADPTLRETLQRVLTPGGLRLQAAVADPTLPARCELDPPALILLDLHHLGSSGLDLCRQIRVRVTLPILVLGATEDRELLLAAINAGANDHLGLPVRPDEMLLRVQANLHRGRTPLRIDTRLRCGPLEIDRQRVQVWREGQAIRLTAKERDLFAFLLAHPGQILPSQLMLEHVWGPAYAAATHVLHAHMSNLRHKIEADPAQPRYLLTERGIGYRLALPPAAQDHPPGRDVAPTSSMTRHQLRASISDFVGRTAEVQHLLEALRQAGRKGKIATISGVQGMGGIGKTELAYVVAHQLRDAFPDAQLVLDLRGSSAVPLPPEQALQQVIRAFTPDAPLPDDLPALQQRYRSVLHDQRVLILADDARDASQVRPLFPPPGCALLITSRQRFTLPGMTTIDLEQLPAEVASTLLCSICSRLSVEEAQAIARACGYLPLALRVSGGILHNTPALPVVTYLAGLADERRRLDQLRDPDDPQLDVEAALALSYVRLDQVAQQVFRQLGVMVADFATALAQMVAELPDDEAVAATLHLLLRRNLVMYDAARGRWRLHDLVRDLARQRLAAAGETAATQWRYAAAAVQVARATQAQYRAGGDGVLAALAQFDADRSHIDAGRCWAAAHARAPEGDQLLCEAAAATRHIGVLRYDARRERIPQWEGAQAAAQRLGDRDTEGLALTNLGIAYADLGDFQRAIPYFEQRLYMARAIGDRQAEGPALTNLGEAYAELGDAWRAIAYIEQGVAIARALGDRHGEGAALGYLGRAYADLGDVRRAIESCAVACTIARAVGDPRQEGYALSTLAHALACQGDHARAGSTFAEALALLRAVGDRWGEAECQWKFGLALAQQGARTRALPLLRAALAYEMDIGHTKAAEHAALLARLEAGEALPAALLYPVEQCTVLEKGGV